MTIDQIKTLCIQAGADFIGISQSGQFFPDDVGVWFNDSKGSTKLLKLCDLTIEKVKEKCDTV